MKKNENKKIESFINFATLSIYTIFAILFIILAIILTP